MKPNDYIIHRLSDFALVPADRLHDCLKEFETAIEIIKIAGCDLEYFKWTDDGKNDIRINLIPETSNETKS